MTTQPAEQINPAAPPRTVGHTIVQPPTPREAGYDIERHGCVGYNASGLPVVNKAIAFAAGLVTIGELARLVNRSPETVKRWMEQAGLGPAAVFQPYPDAPGRQPFLYSRTAFLNGGAGERIRSRPPVRVGLRTSAATGTYRWRDPARWSTDETARTFPTQA